MARLPGWLKYEKTVVEHGRAYAIVHIRRWHPAFWRVAWCAVKQECKLQGMTPFQPVVIIALFKLIMGRIPDDNPR